MWRKYSKFLMVLVIPAWVVISFYAAQAIILGVAWVLVRLGVALSDLNEVVLNTVTTALAYIIALALIILVPWWVKKKKTTLEDVSLDRLPNWTEIWVTPAGFVVYLIISGLLMWLATSYLPGFDSSQVQETGFKNLNQNYEFVLAFLALVVAVPVAEEVLFRGYLFGKLKKIVPVWLAIAVTSLVFGVLHGNLNVIIDTVALSVVLCVLRQITGTIWPSILLHMLKNGIAFYFLFINTSFLTTMGG
ncbi:MAG: type II CAAX endopeptidase family protein [Candidatus Saccharibacteria bacterium]